MAVAAAPSVAFVAAATSVAFVAVDMIDMAYFAESAAHEGKILAVAERFDMAFVAALEAAA